MRINNKAKLYKVLALVLAVSLLAGSIPLAGIGKTARAETPSFFTLQVIRNAALIADDEAIECSFTNNAENGLNQSGSTGADGIWETAYLLGTEYEGGNAFTFTAGEVTVTEEIDLSAVSQYLIIDIADGSHSWADAPVDVSNVVSVTAPEDITGLANGTAKTKAALGLPDFVNIRLSNGESAAATVTWDVDSCDYDPSSVSAQNFEIEGTVALPSKVANGLSVDLSVSVSVSVGGAANATFTTHPQTQTVSAGATVTLTAEAVNADEDTYQWKKDGAEISGATGKTYTISSASASNAGSYTCTVTGINGTVVESNAAIISVEKATIGDFAIDTSVFGNTATRPLAGGIVLTAKNLPDDATGTVSYYLGSELLGTGDSYTYMLESYVEEYTFKAVYEGDSKYAAAEAEVTVNVKKSDQPDLVWSTAPDDTIEFGVKSKYDIFVGGGREGGNYIFSITDQKTVNGEDADAENPIATINESGIYGELVIHNAGSFTVNVYKEGSDDYNDSAVLSKTVVVTKGKYPGFGFENAAPEAITFNDENGNVFVNKAINNKGVDVVYAVVTPEGHTPLATVSDEEPGKIIINSAGTITVSASIAETANYSSAYAEYTLTVNKATQAIAFEKPENAVIYYGEAYANAALEVEVAGATDLKGYGAGDITYEIIAGEDIASVDENGKLTFKNGMLGTVTVKATKATCASYLEATAEYTVTVQEFILNEEPKLEGTAGNNGWYKSDITVTPPEGYKISTSNAIDGDWADNTVVATEGSANKLTVYYRDITTGKISNANEVTSDKLKIDKSAPEELSITLTTSKWYEKILDGITFGVYNSSVSFVLSAKDSVSGVVGFEWKYHKDENAGSQFDALLEGESTPEKITFDNGAYIYTATIGDENSLPLIRGKVSFTATDEAGHTSAPVFGEFNILIDEILPKFDVKYEGALKTLLNTETGEKVSEDGDGVVHYYAGESVKVTVTVDEDSFLADEISISDGSNPVVCEWDDNNSTSFDISGEGEHEIVITYTEGPEETKRVTTYTRTVVIDNTEPGIKIETPATEEIYYSKEPISAKITVDEANFFAEDFKLEIDAKNAAGETIEIATPELTWSLVDGKHEATVLLDKEARYVLKANYTDLATNPAEEFVTGELVYDKTAPEIIGNNADNENLKLSYSDPVNIRYSNPVDELIAAITFNYYQPETAIATVTVKAEDEVAGVETIKYKYVREAGASETNVAALEGDAELITKDGKEYVAKIELPTDAADKNHYRGSFTVWAIDKAGNDSTQHTDDKMVVIVDPIIPKLMSVKIFSNTLFDTANNKYIEASEYTKEMSGYVKAYATEEATVTFEINEVNFYAEDINDCIKVESEEGLYEFDEITWEQKGDVYTGSIVIKGPGKYVVKIEGYKDRSENVLVNYESSEIIIEKEAPVINIELSSEDTDVKDGKYYQKPVTAKIKVKEDNFFAEDFKLEINAKNAAGETIEVTAPELAWSLVDGKHEATVLLATEARYVLKANYTDLATNPAKEFVTDEFVYDKTAPEIVDNNDDNENLKFSYSDPVNIRYSNPVDELLAAITFNYYQPETAIATITVKAEDEVAGVETIKYKYVREAGASETNVAALEGDAELITKGGKEYVAKIELPTDAADKNHYRGSFTVWAIDEASNEGEKYTDDKMVVIVDPIIPKLMSVKIFSNTLFDTANNKYIEASEYTKEMSGYVKAYATEEATVTFEINEVNFYAEDINGCIKVEKDGAAYAYDAITWTQAGDVYTGSITVKDAGTYVVRVEGYKDRSENALVNYESSEIIIEKEAPVITIEPSAAEEIYYSKDTITAKIKVTEDNFFAEDFKLEIDAKNSAGEPIEFATPALSWTDNGNVHEAEVVLDKEARYVLKANYTDLATNPAEEFVTGELVYDKTAPVIVGNNADNENLKFSYSNPVEELIAAITFNYYQPETAVATVTVKAEDATSGVEIIKYKYVREAGASESNVAVFDGDAKVISDDGKTYVAEFTLPTDLDDKGQYRGSITAWAIDKAGNNSVQHTDDKMVVVVDSIIPEMMSAEITAKNENAGKYYSNDTATVTFKVKEANFYAEDINGCIKVEKDGTAYAYDAITWTQAGDVYTGSITVKDAGTYVVRVEGYKDRSGNALVNYESPEIIIDKTAPITDIKLSSDDASVEDGKYYQKPVTAKITVTETNFLAKDFKLVVEAKDADNNPVKVEIPALSWTDNGDVHEATVLLDKEARYTVTADYTDLAKTPAKQETTGEFVYDETAPSKDGISISYSEPVPKKVIDAITFGLVDDIIYRYYNPIVEVTVTAKDEVARVKTIEWSYAREAGASETNVETATGVISDLTVDGSTATGKFKLPLNEIENKQYRGSITAWATDNAGNDGSESNKFVDTDNVVIVDTVTPVVSVKYEADRAYDKNTFADVEEADFNAGSTVLISKETATVTYTVTEANFDSDEQDYDYFNRQFVIKKDGVAVNNIKPVWTEAEAADTHTGVITFTEEGDYTVSIAFKDRSGNVTETYESPVIAIDKTAPVISAKYNNAAVKDIYNENVTVEFTVTERHFNPDLFDFSFVKSVDITGTAVLQTVDFTADLRKATNWTHTGDKHTAKITLANDAIYAFTADCDDMIGHEANQLTSGEFIIDKTAPDTNKIRIEYTTEEVGQIILDSIFLFYNTDVTVEIYAEDMTSGIEKMEWEYNRENGASDVNLDTDSGTVKPVQEADKKTFVGTFTLPEKAAENIRGNVSVVATDRANNSSDKAVDTEHVVIIDKIAPEIEVEFQDPKQVVNKDNLQTANGVAPTDASGNYKFIYDEGTYATITITEANFDLVNASTNSEDKPVVTINGETAPNISWSNVGDDKWEGRINFNEEGAHELKVEFTDPADNVMETYISNTIVVDKTNPVISVTYEPSDSEAKTTENEKTYFGENRTATIVITEENFRASDVEATITAKDINGTDVSVENFNSYLKNDSNWTHSGDRHTATITYSADANYTFDIEYTDLALRPAADYAPDTFAVDKTKPANLSIEYSNSVKDVQDGSVTYKYYKDPVTVTLIANDQTAGVKEFNYSYLVSDNVSSRNQGLSNQTLSGGSLNSAGDRTTADFTIPSQGLSGENQFRGNVEFFATDKSANQSEVFKDTDEVIIVDNIAPKMSVEINDASAVVNGIHYFNNGASATITIEEANFYPEDVKITVNGDPVTLTDWSSNGDVRTATLNLNDDGEYKVYIEYTDRSGNAGESYESEQIIIDNTKPSITVSGIAHESANNGEKIGFTVSANDDNFNASEFKPVLTAVVPDENGNYKTMTIDVGSPQSVDGKTYRYVIDNLDTDAIYTLSCVAKDLSGNENNVMIISDSGNAEMTAMQFSVNRNGSAYMLDKYTSDMTDKFYIHDVEQNIVIVEVNVDALSEHRVELNGVALTPDKDYTVTVTGGDGASWYKYTYSINASLFAEEGEYSVVVVSKDKTDTTAFSDIKGGAINFVVDRTAPTVTVSGIGKDGRYQASSRTVTVVPLDNGGQLYSVKIVVTDANGNVIATPIELFGDKLTEALASGNGALTFELGEGMYQNVEITCVDIAGNEYFSEEAFHNITVSPSRWVIMWANPVIRWSAVGAVAAIALGIFFIIFFKKRKKDKEEA